MRAIGLTALAAVLFVGGFAFVRAQDGDLLEELAALERAADALRHSGELRSFTIPPPPARIHRIPVMTVTSPLFLRDAPGGPPTFEGVSTGIVDEPEQPYGTIEEVAELLSEREVQLGFDEPELIVSGMELIYRGQARVAARIESYLEKELRPRVLRTAQFEVDWEMGAGRGDESFRARFLTLVGSRGMFWVGRQQAIVTDFDVSPTYGPLGIADPVIDRVYTGEWVLPHLIGVGASLEGTVRFESRRLVGRMRRVATRRSGILDLPRMRETATRPHVRLTADGWERIYRGDGILRVRARIVERGEAR